MQSCQGSGDGGGAVSLLQVRKLRLRDVKALDQGHTASRWQSRDGTRAADLSPSFRPLCVRMAVPLSARAVPAVCICLPQTGSSRGAALGSATFLDPHITAWAASLVLPSTPGVMRAPYLCGITALAGGNSDLLYFAQEETEAPGGEVTCSRSHSWWWQSWEGRAGPPTHGQRSQGEGRAPVSGESLPEVMGRAPQAGATA